MPDALRSVDAPGAQSRCDCHGSGTLTLARPRADRESWSGEVGYVVMGYPRISETFITQEIEVLESLGARLRVFAIKAGDTQQVHDSVSRIRAPVTYLPRATSLSGTTMVAWLAANLPRFWRAHASLVLRRPAAWCAVLASAVAMCWRYRQPGSWWPRKVFVKEFLQAGVIASHVIGARTVRHLHGHFCHGATTVTWFASRLAGVPFSFTAHAKDIYQADQNPGDLLLRKLRATRFVATCTEANRRHLAQLTPRHSAIHTVYHGLDTAYFAPRPRADRAGPVEILAVGRLVEKKGFRYLVEACDRLKLGGIDFRCRIVGEDGPEREDIERMIARAGLGAQMVLHPPVTHARLREFYAAADIFVLPCLVAADGDRDGIPNVLAEAMATGLPVVTTPVSGIPELVRAGRDGLVVAERDAEALATALRDLAASSAMRDRFGAAARARVVEMFDARATTASLKSLFAEVLKEAGTP